MQHQHWRESDLTLQDMHGLSFLIMELKVVWLALLNRWLNNAAIFAATNT